MKLLDFQLVLNSEREEELVRGLERATKQILREHGYEADPFSAVFSPRPEGNEELILEGGGEDEAKADSHDAEEGEGEESDDDDQEEDEEGDRGEDEEYGDLLKGMEESFKGRTRGEADEEVDDDEEDDEEEDGEEEEEDGEEEEGDEDEEGGEEGDVEGSGDDAMEHDTVDMEVDEEAAGQAGEEEKAEGGPRREVQGLLKEYLESSPEAAELQQLWELEKRKSWKRVCEKHSLLLAAILTCLQGTDSRQGPLLSRRTLSERSSDLHLQLISNNHALATSTLCLLAALVRFSSQAAREVLLRVSLVSKPVLHLFSPASGKTSRRASVGLVAWLLRVQDGDVVARVVGNERLLSAVSRSLGSDQDAVVLLWLSALRKVLHRRQLPLKSKRRLFSYARLDQLRRLYAHRPEMTKKGGEAEEGADSSVSRADVLEALDRLLRYALSPAAGLFRVSAAASSARAKAASGTHMLDSRSWALVRLLLGLATSADDARQRQLVLHVLQQYPRLSPFFMRRLTQSWEPRTGFQGLASYSFLASLLLKLPLPPRPFLTGEHDHHHHRGAWSSESAERFLSVLLPAGLGKRELTKATLSPDGLLQRAGLILVSRILQRVSGAVALVVPPGAPRPPGFRAVGVALAQRLPELQSLLALRTRCLASPSSGEAGMASARGMHVYLLMLQVLRGYHELMPEMTEAARFDFLRLINEVPDLSALPSPVLLELLRLLGALGPQRLQWLPPDPQAWASGHEPAPTALTQLLRLLVSEEGEGPLRRQAAAMVSSLACNAGAPGEALVAALLDCRSVEGSAAFLEFALRLTAHQPYAFALLALRGGVPSRVSAIVPTMLFLVGASGDEDEVSPIRSELQGFGLHVDKLRGRFAGSKGAKEVTRKLLLSVAAGLEAVERAALAALVARLGANDVATEVVAAGLGGKGGVKAARKKLQEAMAVHASKAAGKKRRREGQDAAVVDHVASVLGSLGARAVRTEEGLAVVADALCWAAEAVGHADVAERLGGVLRQWMALGKEEGGAAFDLYSLGEDKAERVAAMLPLDLLVELAAVAASAGEKKRRKAVKRSLSAALQRAEAVAGLLPGTARACAELERLSSSTGEGGQSDLLLWLLVATACRAWELGGVQGMSEVLLAVMKAGEGGAEGSFITSPAVATVLRTFLPVLLAGEARRPLERWTRRWLLPSEEQQHAGLRSSIIGLLLLSPALGAAGQATLTRRLVMGLMGPGGGEDGGAEWVGLVVHQLLGPAASDNKDRRPGHDWLLEPHAAAALRAVWRTAGGTADGEAGLALPQIAAMVLSVLEADADGRARRVACPEAAAWCWEELARGGNECVTAGRLLAELCRASDTCCLHTLERLSRMVREAGGGLQSSLPPLLLGLGPVVAVLVRRLGAEDEEPRMRSALEMLLRPLVEAWLRVATEEGSECDERTEEGVVSGLQFGLDLLVPQSAAAGRSKAQAGLIEHCASLAASASAEEDAARPLALPCLTVLVRWVVTRDPSQGHLVGGLAARACKEARSMMVDDGEEEPSSLGRPLACLKSLLRAEETRPLLAAGSWGKELVRLGEACCSGSGGEALVVVKDLLVQRGSSKGVARMLQSLANNPNLSGWLHPSSSAALPLLQLLLWLFSRAGNAEVGKQLLPPLVHGYRGSMSATDRLMLRLMWIISSDAGVEMKLGPWLRPGQAVEQAGVVEAGSAEWVVQWMDVQAVYRTLAAFPFQRPLYPPRTRWEEEGDDEEAGEEEEEGDEEENSGRREAGAGVYDPAFVLPLADAYLRSEADCSLRGLQSSGMMALAMVSLSSRQRPVRLCACSVLQHMATRLEEAPRADAGSKERPQLSLLLRLLGTSLTASLDPLPYGVALFMARACHVMGSPANDLYVALNTFLLKRSQLSLEDLPLFYELFYSSRPFHRRELVWVLRLMGDSLQTSEDLSIHRRRHYLSLLLLWLDGAANHSGGGADDSRVLAMGLAVIKAAAKIPGGTEHLVNEVGLLAWAGGMLHAAAPPAAGRRGGGPPSSPKLLGHAVLVLEALEAVLQQRWADAAAPGGAQQLAVLVQTLLAFAATLSSTRGRTPPPPVRQALRLVLRCLGHASQLSGGLQLSMVDARRLVDCADLASVQPRQSKQQADKAAEQDRVMVLKLLLDAEPAAGAEGRGAGWSAIGGAEEDEQAMAVEDEEGDEGQEAREVREGEEDLLALLSWCTSSAASCLHQAPLQQQEAVDALELCSRTGEWALSLLQRRPSLLAPLCAAQAADGGAATAAVAKSPFWPALLQIVHALRDPASSSSASSNAGMAAWVEVLLLCCLQRAGGGASAVLQAALAVCRAARQEDDDVAGRRLRRLAHLAAHAGSVFGEGAIDPAAEAEEVAAIERTRQPSSWRSAIGGGMASAPSPLTGGKKRRSEGGGKQKKATPTKVRKKARAEGGS